MSDETLVRVTEAPSRIPDQPCVDCLDHSLAAGRRRLAVPRRVAFWLLALVFTITMLDTTTKSIEEIATTILHRAGLQRHAY